MDFSRHLLLSVTFLSVTHRYIQGQECERKEQNMDVEGFYVDASHDAPNADLALVGSGDSWNPMVQDTVQWSAGVPKSAKCTLFSIKFKFRFSRMVKVSVRLLGDTVFNVIETIEKPYDRIPEKWMSSGVIKFPLHAQELRIKLFPTEGLFETPALKDVIVTMCCQAVCDDKYLNNEFHGFYTDANYGAMTSDDALAASGKVWKPMHAGTIYWYASIPDEEARCRLFTVKVTFRYTWEVDVKVKLFGGTDYIDVTTVFKPETTSAKTWIQSDKIKLPMNVQTVLLKAWPSMETSADMPEYKDVKVAVCCNDEPVPCDKYLVNYKLKLSSSFNKKQAKKALAGVSGYWSPKTTDTSTWTAKVPDDKCPIYSIEFDVAKTWEVVIKFKRFYSTSYEFFTELAAPANNPGGIESWSSGRQVLDLDLTDADSIESVQLIIYAGMEGSKLVVSQLDGVKVITCCDTRAPRVTTPAPTPKVPPTPPPKEPTTPPPKEPPTPPPKEPPTPPQKEPPTPPPKEPPTPPPKEPPTPPPKEPPTPPPKEPPTPPPKEPPTPPPKEPPSPPPKEPPTPPPKEPPTPPPKEPSTPPPKEPPTPPPKEPPTPPQPKEPPTPPPKEPPTPPPKEPPTPPPKQPPTPPPKQPPTPPPKYPPYPPPKYPPYPPPKYPPYPPPKYPPSYPPNKYPPHKPWRKWHSSESSSDSSSD